VYRVYILYPKRLSSCISTWSSEGQGPLILRELLHCILSADIAMDGRALHDEDAAPPDHEDPDQVVDEEQQEDNMNDEDDVSAVTRVLQLRDKLFDPDLENMLSWTRTNGEVAYEGNHIGYRPKNGDYSNLQLFMAFLADSVDRDEINEAFPRPVVVWLPNNDGLCVIKATRGYFPWERERRRMVCTNGNKFSPKLSVSTWTSNACSNVYLQQHGPVNFSGDGHTTTANCDCVLEAFTTYAIATHGLGLRDKEDRHVSVGDNDDDDEEEEEEMHKQLILRGPHSVFTNSARRRRLQGNINRFRLGDCFSLSAWQSCMKRLADEHVPLGLRNLSLTKEQWDVLERAEDLNLKSYIPIPDNFWRETRASEVYLHPSVEVSVSTLVALGARTKLWAKSVYRMATVYKMNKPC
jgi:hypothetical protein